MDSLRQTNSGWNRRPLVAVAVMFALGIVLGRYYHFQTVYIAAAVLTIAAVLLFRKKGFLLVCIAAGFFAAFLSAAAMDVDYIETADEMQITGRVYSQPYQNDYGSTIYYLNQVEIDGQQCGNVKLYISDGQTPAFEPGDVIETTAEVEIPKGVRNPGGFDEQLYLLSQGVTYKAYAESAAVVDTQGRAIYCVYTGKRVNRGHGRQYF